MIRIIVVEDNVLFRELLVANLTKAGHQATGVGNSAGLYRELLQASADIVVLDVELPDQNGFDVARELRAMRSTKRIGIIMVTAHDSPDERVDGISSGADIYLTKPVHPQELDAYVQRLHRRLHDGEEASSTRRWHYRRQAGQLLAPSGTALELTHTEAAFVDILACHVGKPVERRDIIGLALKKNPLEYDARRLEAMVSRLRKKIRAAYPLSQPIKVAHAVGYIFTEDITVQ
ncbi:response regulator transcription factor [Noviherbaspirillum sp. 1P10PC]|uniref:response regulator transcription factor n=1 Tax=Noviherbaspirillum sp. 1P10PC TaxID=3132292 RepID=UPI0039A0A572